MAHRPTLRVQHTRVLTFLVAALLFASTVALFSVGGGNPAVNEAEAPSALPSSAPAEEVVAQEPALVPPVPTTSPAKPATKAKPTQARRAPAKQATGRVAAASGRATAYGGMGTWVDVFDWSNTFTGGRPGMSPGDVDRMADRGVQTLYIQASRFNAPGDGPLEPDLLQAYIGRAHARGIRVVAWYLPNFVDLNRDVSRLVAIGRLPVDGLAVDIEATDVGDVAERNRRLVQLSSSVRGALPGRQLAAVVLPPVVTEVINRNYWPAFPYRQLAPYYDVWMPMSYWTNRTDGSGYRDAYRYTRENVERLRSRLGNVAVHAIGGIGDASSPADVGGFRRAVVDTGSIGGSLYDWRTTGPGIWTEMQGLRR